ncbi:uncharacterized protein METZ01_LOCUS160994 [marine metagenome]|uniref:glycine--tRNA ligase n=1 Tax=marine metagenome TaxID=408172 RepID=A0A382B2V9_9ZZZZ
MSRTLNNVPMDKIVSLSKRRGFIFQSSEIYGGLASTYDYGPMGIELKRNIKDAWWQAFIQSRDDMVGVETAILMHPEVWVASGHTETFTDPLVECKTCNHRFRADHLDSELCPDCNGELTDPQNFNLMFRTFLGPMETSAHQVYLRPETAQGIFVNFQNVLTSSRKRLPFGIGQIGKSFRNEITTGNFTFRTREFEQMEIEYFVKPEEASVHWTNWIDDFFSWFVDLGIRAERLRVRPHEDKELSHYSTATSDIEYDFAWGWGELMGIANRTDYDLRAHTKHSGVRLDYFDEDSKSHIVPYVVEPALGLDRALLVFLFDAYDEEMVGDDTRTVLHLHPKIAPVKVGVLPLSRNAKLVPKAREIYDLLRQHFVCEYDDTQSIGRRYRRQDEIGTPQVVTIDFQTIEEDNAVTVRDRDTMSQIRVPVENLVETLREKLES